MCSPINKACIINIYITQTSPALTIPRGSIVGNGVDFLVSFPPRPVINQVLFKGFENFFFQTWDGFGITYSSHARSRIYIKIYFIYIFNI